MNVSINIQFDKNATTSELKARQRRGIMVATSELRRYADPYVRFSTGTTKKSAYIASDLQKGLVVYDTPYASYAYYNEHNHVTTDHNPNARPKWGEYTKQHHIKEIERAVQREVLK